MSDIYERLDQLVDTDPIGLRTEAWALASVVRILHKRVVAGGPSNISTRWVAEEFMAPGLVDIFLEVIQPGEDA